MSDCLEDLENGVTKSSPESYHAVRVVYRISDLFSFLHDAPSLSSEKSHSFF